MNSLEHPAEGLEDGPAAMDSFKRAVIRAAPSKFTVEMLGAAKQGGSYSYGMRICPITSRDRSSMSSHGSYSEYDVWRRWEDCLAFQGTLELEYRRMARQKRQRLLRGKGVKKNGFYKQDQASSWESLPPGPDPNSVARDIHEYIPLLTRKGTVFRASQATIDQRASELKALVEGLFRDDMPALVDELRNDRIVTDFFGYWRRDQELLEKQRKQQKSSSKSRTSVTSSIFSMYFSSSNPSVQNVHSYPETISTSRSSSTYHANDTAHSIVPRNRKTSSDSSDGSPMRGNRRRAYSTGSSNAESSSFTPSTPSERSLDSPVHTHVPLPAVADDVSPIAFDHNPHASIGERPSSALAILPEGREMSLKTDTSSNPPPVTRRRGKSAAADTNPARNGVVFLSPPSHHIPSPVSHIDDRFLEIPDRSVRDSWQTMDSASCILDGMDVTLPISPTDQSNRASVATFMTDCTVEGVLPRSPNKPYPLSPSYGRHVSPARSRIVSGPVSVSEFDHDWSDPEDDILDTFLADSFPLPAFDVPEIVELPPQSQPQTPYPEDEQLTPSCLPVPVSPVKSATFSVSTTVSTPQTLTIKAGYNDSLIVLRVPCDVSYKDLRQRLYNKFVGQEGVPLSDSFTISFLQPVSTPEPAPAAKVTTRKRSNSLSSDPVNNTMYPVASEADWEIVAASIEGSKLALRIFDKAAS
ncbi:hypothetical protein Hypma_006740 [Hypsizygus marmoreus]|uniref:PX domain-containing protein n=1 Tax=Hypsizygus marmoreus TaxID=39966 RepID=A0A369K3B4_HYPMA|nr:hypothetical protein Hypma_006740 [Hypsizygus marmoreus]